MLDRARLYQNKLCLSRSWRLGLASFVTIGIFLAVAHAEPEACQKALSAPNLNLPVSIQGKYTDSYIEEMLPTLVSLSSDQQKQIVSDLTKKIDASSSAMTVGDFLLLGVFDEGAWKKYLTLESRNFYFVGFKWWARAYLIEKMPEPLYHSLRAHLVNLIETSQGTVSSKRASRLLTIFQILRYHPERALSAGLEDRKNLDELIGYYFQQNRLISSHYKQVQPVDLGQFKKLILLLQQYFTENSIHAHRPIIYWFGSIPNGRGKNVSDFDFAMDLNLSLNQVESLQKYLSAEQQFVKIDKTKAFDIKTVEFTANNLLFMSPLSIAFKEGQVYLVVRELILPKVPFMTLLDQMAVFSKFVVKLKHYPVKISESGDEWDYDPQGRPWEIEY